MARASFRVIRNEVEDFSLSNQPIDDGKFTLQLKKWKRYHWLVCHFVDQLNDNFGFILFFDNVYTFIDLINGLLYNMNLDMELNAQGIACI